MQKVKPQSDQTAQRVLTELSKIQWEFHNGSLTLFHLVAGSQQEPNPIRSSPTSEFDAYQAGLRAR
eukprot:10432232-Prorocentrum_lima.AAC.1